MTVTEEQRHELIKRFEETLEPEHAETVAELLPPVGWADIATKQDIALVRTELHASEDGIGRSMAELEARLSRSLITWMLTGMGVQTAAIGLVVGLT